MTPTAARNQLLRRTTAASLAVHAVLILLPGALLETLGSGAPRPGPRNGFVVSLYPLPEEPTPEPSPEPAPAEIVEPEPEVLPEPEPVLTAPETRPETRPETPPSSKPSSAAGVAGGESGTAAGGTAGTPGPPDGGKTAGFQPPRLLAGALPIDPENSDDLEIPEEIPVRLRVGTTGKVIEIVPADPGLSKPVLAAIERSARAMRFAPARRGKNPVEAWFTMTFIYRK